MIAMQRSMELREAQVHGVVKARSGSVNQLVDAKRWCVGGPHPVKV